MEQNVKNYKYKLALIFITISILVVVFTNSYRSIGHKVTQFSFGTRDVTNCVGYTQSDQGYSVSEDYHFITTKHDPNANEATIIVNKKMAADTNVYIWYVAYDGSIIEEYETTWGTNGRLMILSNLPDGVSYVSYKIDADFSLNEVISSNSYNKLIQKLIVIFFELIFLLLLYIFICKKNIAKDKIVALDNHIFSISKNKLLKMAVCVLALAATIAVLYILDRTLLKESTFINVKHIILVISIICFVAWVVIKRKQLFERVEVLFAATLMLIGSLYAFLFPISFGVNWDDHIHYKNACALVKVIDRKDPLSFEGLNADIFAVANDKLTFDRESAKERTELYDKIDSEGFFIPAKNKVSYGSIVYLPTAIGLIVSKGLMLPYHIQLLFGRWMNVFLLAIVCYFAMKKLKYGKIVVFLLMMSPTNMFLSGSYNYDIWLTSWIILGLAYLFTEYQDRDSFISKKSSIIISVSMFLAILLKQVYFLLVIPAFVLPKKKFKAKSDRRLYYLLITLAVSLPFVLLVINNLVNTGTGDTRGGSGVNAPEQINFILNNIWFVVELFFNFLRSLLNPFAAGDGYLTMLGFGGVVMDLRIPLLVILSGCIICHESKKGYSFPVWYRFCVILLYIAIGAIVTFAMYVSFTPVGADYVQGVQGRYLIPAFFPLVYVLTRIPVKEFIVTKIGKNRINLLYVLLMMGINIYAIYMGCIRYY